MASQVYYRKWRPQTLADVVGQEPITRTLLNALITGRVAHAYLFFGPRGTGKTSTGRILAKAVNCLHNEAGEPCNKCAMCQAFIEGRAIDLIEIDAASNTGVDDIRNLKEKINFAPNIAKYKVYIIDEVHMLSNSAFNALLKTLEEPPAHVIFILATTEVHKVPATIISRCQRFDFRRIPQSATVGRLEHICRQEGIDADPKALALISRSATGSLRDAQNLLEQMVVYHGRRIELQQVRAELGLTGDARIKELARAILSRDMAGGLAMINSVAGDGLDLRHFNRELLDYLRQMLLIKAGAGESTGMSGEEIGEAKEISANASLQEISQAIKLFAQADFRFSPQSTLPLELALVDHALPKSAETAVKTIPKPKDKSEEILPPLETLKKEIEPTIATAIPENPLAQGAPDVEYIQQHWSDFVNACRREGIKGNLDALLRGACKPIALDGTILTLGFTAEFNRSQIDNPKNRKILETILKKVFGMPYEIRCVLIGKEARSAPPPPRESSLVKEALSRGARIISEE
ncbi:MAG: DNA polymerase III subunit gamma/tau [Dehalococcoidia bacterium]|nr:DNA polymerase III subunit gamma/tau [Dehalococcoidia bacterium]